MGLSCLVFEIRPRDERQTDGRRMDRHPQPMRIKVANNNTLFRVVSIRQLSLLHRRKPTLEYKLGGLSV